MPSKEKKEKDVGVHALTWMWARSAYIDHDYSWCMIRRYGILLEGEFGDAFHKKLFDSATMNRENQPLATNEPGEFEKYLVEVQDFVKIGPRWP